jgi:hypothetical protein
MRDRLEIEEILRDDVQRKTKEFGEAKRNFWQVCSEVPSGIPHPDGARRIQNTAHAQNVAIQALADAIHRFNDFLVNGTVPPDYLAPQRPATETLSPDG